MLRHTVLFRFKEDTSEEAIAALEVGLARMPATIAGIKRYEFGRDAGITEGMYDFALVADFDDADAYREYASHPDHLDLIRTCVVPIVDDTVRVQYEVG